MDCGEYKHTVYKSLNKIHAAFFHSANMWSRLVSGNLPNRSKVILKWWGWFPFLNFIHSVVFICSYLFCSHLISCSTMFKMFNVLMSICSSIHITYMYGSNHANNSQVVQTAKTFDTDIKLKTYWTVKLIDLWFQYQSLCT